MSVFLQDHDGWSSQNDLLKDPIDLPKEKLELLLVDRNSEKANYCRCVHWRLKHQLSIHSRIARSEGLKMHAVPWRHIYIEPSNSLTG